MKNLNNEADRTINIALCGKAGQGIQTVEKLFTRILKSNGYNIFATKEYMSRVRGGMNSTVIRISEKPVNAYSGRIDILIPLDAGSIGHLKNRITSETIILGEKENFGDKAENQSRVFEIPFTKTASDIGNKIYSNIVAVGALMSFLSVKPEKAADCLKEFFKTKSQEILDHNIKALEEGYKQTVNQLDSIGEKFDIPVDSGVKDHILVNGAEAVGLGAIAGGCNFVSSYPMSPSTGVLTFLAQNGKDFGIIAEQAEDEIAAVNMSLGAWYAGARAMATTSGGGFALMTEGVSLAGMIESPLVVHLAQRPGPATGLPTRTEQGDLELALYAGHGEFPRIIFAPGNLQEGFVLTQKAFNLADKFQVPVFILTDQFFIDSYYNLPPFDLKEIQTEKCFVKTQEDYRRFKLTEDGISPRGIPGFGKGLVKVDSDEHDEHGYITEDMDTRNSMVNKRLKKLDLIKQNAEPPKLYGPENFEKLLICWGSNLNVVLEATAILDRQDTSLLHFSQVYPLDESCAEMIQKADKTIIIENNATAQFARLLKIHTGIEVDHKILKYDGICFASDDLAETLNEIL